MQLISVIVPIYKVEKYLRECINSVINQTYKNLEIILVDDGSPDSCPDICDEYANIDPRIKVIHRENGGLSAARNSGIDICTGEYIFFLDSDDILDKDAIAFLYKKTIETKVDIAVCCFYYLYKDSYIPKCTNVIEAVVNGEQAFIDMLIMDYTFPCAWGKLYKRQIFQNLRYPENKLYEDTYIIGDVLFHANNVYITTLPKLYYRQCKSSIMNSSFNPTNMQLIDAYEHCMEISKKHFPSSSNTTYWRYLWSLFVLLQNIIQSNGTALKEFDEVVALIKKNTWGIIKCKEFSIKKKLSIFVLFFSRKLYIKLYKTISIPDDKNEYFD